MPSTRFRWKQYASEFQDHAIEAFEIPSRFGAYAPPGVFRRPVWLMAAMADNARRVAQSGQADVCFLQRNLIATLHTLEGRIRKPIVLDVDDAIFLGPRGASADRIARQSALILCGNTFLATHFRQFGNTAILPTAVDTDLFTPDPDPGGRTSARPTIGWSGTSSGFPYLYAIESALKTILDRVPDAILKIVADRAPQFQTLPPHRVVFERWSPAREAAVLREFSVGLMPLEDTPWARGKCSFKMLTYMACGIPVVVSPVGMNTEVLGHGACGYAASTQEEWIDTVSSLLRDEATAHAMGKVGRQITQTHYARRVIGPKLAQLLRAQAR